ncbi:MAG: prolyl 4-hydroxylase [Sphingomonadales bacterium]|jgi:prolyl 4-hydroxylase|nr:prolyl 4-hydroxylase [Sphingomonadales bacterium]
MAPGGTIGQVDALLAARRFPEAAGLLVAAAGAGETEALAELAHWRIAGNIIRRDLAEARRLLGLAAAAGDDESASLHAGFLASGTGGPDDWAGALAVLRKLAARRPRAAEQLGLIEAVKMGAGGFPEQPFPTETLSQAPFVAAARGFMTEAECRYLRTAGEPALQPSVVADPATGRMMPHPVRSSDATMFGVYAEDLVINALNRRIAALSGTRLDQGEPLQLLRYRPGGEYKPHMDALPAEPNQRILTVLVYLSDDYRGGETRFPHSGLSFRGRTGDALLFRNADVHGRPDPLSLHAGLPVTKGTKYLASRWIRADRFTYPAPRPILDL